MVAAVECCSSLYLDQGRATGMAGLIRAAYRPISATYIAETYWYDWLSQHSQ